MLCAWSLIDRAEGGQSPPVVTREPGLPSLARRGLDPGYGEAFLALVTERFGADGLYLLDEPEAALSLQRQLSLIAEFDRLARQDRSQLIVATHSPILLAYPHAKILALTSEGVAEVEYEQTEEYSLTRDCLVNRERYLRHLLGDGEEEGRMDRELVGRFIDAAVEDHTAAAKMLADHPELLAARYIHGETPLHFCAVEGFVEGVRFLAEAGMRVDAVNEFGDTALIDAVTLGRSEVVRVLLKHGADPNATSTTRDPMLHDAITRGSTDIALALLDAGARPDYVTTAVIETIWDAVERSPKRKEMLAALARHGISPIK